MKTGIILLAVLVITACQAQTPAPLSEGMQVFFLDSLEASRRVSRDAQEGFFERIGRLDMEIQMKMPRMDTLSDEEVNTQYLEFIRRDVSGFSEKELARLQTELGVIREWCRAISPHLWPDTLRLIKTRGSYYGPGAWYTREDYIVIPGNTIHTSDAQSLRGVLLHEVFHVLSRNRPGLREGLYKLIGFYRLENPPVIPSPLRERLLLNPDGADQTWAIRLQDTVEAIPLIFSRFDRYNPQFGSFFSHLEFGLFALDPSGAELYTTPEGNSTLGKGFEGDYKRQIRDNTGYLIHPDEILADNFSLLVSGSQGQSPVPVDRFSDEGRALLESMRTFLQNWNGN